MAAANDLATGGGRTLAELKAEIARRAARGGPPLGGIRAGDARAALERIRSLDREQWARAFADVAESHLAAARECAAHDRVAAAEAYWRAWRLFHFARWPTENTPARVAARASAFDAFRAYSGLLDPVIETLRVPHPAGDVVAYLRVPRTAEPPPVVLAISGLDSRKEDIAAHSETYLARGLAMVAVDMPGTGDAPLGPLADAPESLFSALIDHLHTRSDVDATRLVVQGRSFSGYWAAKLAVTERERLRGAVMHGGPIHHTFQPGWCAQALQTGEYLYDYFDAWRAMLGAATLDELLDRARRLSLLDLGLLDRPAAPMLVVNGARDSQISIEDAFLLLKHGDAKEAWINPGGGHMGRSPEWPQNAIAEQILLPWMSRRLAR
jgi:pimeloyl-ACP methyl ester carboxylesterase